MSTNTRSIYWVTKPGRENDPPPVVLAIEAHGAQITIINGEKPHLLRGKSGTFYVDADLYDTDEVRQALGAAAIASGSGAITLVDVSGYDAAESGPDDEIEPDAALWGVRRDGGQIETCVVGYNDGDRGRIAFAFASDDDAGWSGDTYDELVWVRRMRPEPECEPGVAIRIKVERDRGAEREWHEK